MQTIKTGIVVALLLAVCYGAFIALNAPETEIPAELEQWANSVDMDEFMSGEMSGSSGPLSMDSDSSVSGAEALSSFGLGQPAEQPAAPSLPTFDFNGEAVANSVGSEFSSSSLPSVPMPTGPDVNNFGASELPGGDLYADNAAGTANVPPPTFPPVPNNPNAMDNSTTALGSGANNMGPSIPFNPDAPSESSNARSTAADLVSIQKSASESNLALPLLDPNAMPGPSGSELGGSEIGGSELGGSELSKTEGFPSEPFNPDAGPTKTPTLPFSIAREQALAKANQGNLKEALSMLSAYYSSPELVHSEHDDLIDILDALSREVIYSKRHLVASPHRVKSTDTLESVAAQYKITPELLSAVNGLTSQALIPSTELKVMNGPFHAEVSKARGELTLFLGDLYAGRFPVSFGSEVPVKPGVFAVGDRRTDRTYYGPNDVLIRSGQPENPYGNHWLGLADNLCIHGSPEMARSDLAGAGCISLAPRDAQDVYNILTKQSYVEIKR